MPATVSTSMWAPGSQSGRGLPSGSAKQISSTPSATGLMAVTRAGRQLSVVIVVPSRAVEPPLL